MRASASTGGARVTRPDRRAHLDARRHLRYVVSTPGEETETWTAVDVLRAFGWDAAVLLPEEESGRLDLEDGTSIEAVARRALGDEPRSAA